MKEKIADYGIRKAMGGIRRDRDKAIARLLKGMDLISLGRMPAQRRVIREGLENKDSNVYQMLDRALTGIDADCFDTLVSSFAVNAGFGGGNIQEKMREEHDCNIPWAILLDPTSACNLHCAGCWAADYGNRLNLTLEDIHSSIG